MKQSNSWLLGTLCVSILAGCAGSGKSVPAGNSAAPLSLVRTTVSINIAAGAGAQGVRPKYVSPSTLGVAITIYGALATPPPGPTTVANLSTGSSLCTSNPDGSRTCTVSVLAPIGNDNFIVTTYDQPPLGTAPQGNILSTTTLQFVIVAGQTNTVPLTLNGVPATIVLSPPGFLVPPNQTNTFAFNVNAKDAAGNYIIGPGNYTQPIALAITNDPSHTISLSTTSIASPATTSVTGTYNGGSLPGIATITGSATGASSGTTTVQSSSAVTQVTVIVPPPATTASLAQQVLPQSGLWSIPGIGGFSGSIAYSTNNAASGTNANITASMTAPSTLPNPLPSGTPLLYVSLSLNQAATFTQGIESLSVTLPSSVATAGQTFYETVYDLTAGTNITNGPNTIVGGTGNQTVTFGPGPTQSPNSVTFPANENYLIVISQATIVAYAASAGGSNSVYAFTINASSGALTPVAGSPFAAGNGTNYVAVDPMGKFAYASNQNYPASSGSVSGYTINSSTGALSPMAGSPFVAGASPYGVAIDPTGRFLYEPNIFSNNVYGYTIDATSGTLTPAAGSPFAGPANPEAMAIDPTGRFAYVSNTLSNNVTAYTIDATSGALAQMAGSPFGAGTTPRGVSIDPTGKFAYVANSGSNDVSAYTISATSGALTPVPGSTFAAGTGPFGAAVDPTGKFVYVTNSNANSVSAYTINPASGALTPVAGSPFGVGAGPLEVAFDPAGRFAYVTNCTAGTISAYSINATSGALTPLAGPPYAAGNCPFGITVTRPH